MATIQELKAEAKKHNKNDDFEEALNCYNEIWEREKSDWTGYFLVQCLRKTRKYEDARDLLVEIKAKYPSFRPIHNEELWLDYSEKIKDKKNPKFLAEAEILLSKTNPNDQYTASIYSKTILTVVKHLMEAEQYSTALIWLDKLDFSILSNSPFSYKDQKYSSDKKTFFRLYADVLIKLDRHIEYIESCLSCLGFVGNKHTQFKKYIIENSTYLDYDNNVQVSRIRFALFLKYFKEEIYNREKKAFTKIFKPKITTLISNLGDFEFCPVSFAINETYAISSNAPWELDEWHGEKQHLIHRYKSFQKNKNIEEAFNDILIDRFDNEDPDKISPEIFRSLKNDFNEILNSKLVINNYDSSNPSYSSNQKDTIRGSPEYVFETSHDKRFVVIEKFTKRTPEGVSNPFYNDLIKLYGYIFELASLNIEYGYLIYWFWQVDDIQDSTGKSIKKIRIRAYRIFKIEKTNENRTKLSATIDRLRTFKQTGTINVDGDRISHPKKCLNCSVVSYCNHKTGKYNTVTLPYSISSMPINSLPSISFSAQNTMEKSNNESDDLPF